MTAPDFSDERRDAFAERLLGATLGMMDTLSVYIGGRLGFYDALANTAMTPQELARASGCAERYVQEWLEQQAATGILEVAEAAAVAHERRYALPAEHCEVLVDRDSLNYLAPLAQLVVGAASPLPALLDAYRSGGGVPYAGYGADLRVGQADINRATFLQLLPSEWLPAMADVDARLKAQPPARVADIGSGAGWSSIGIARGYPLVRVDGFDLDRASVDLANANVKGSGVEDRVTFALRDAGDAALSGSYDLVCVFEAVHDMSDPVAALRTMRRLMAPGAAALVVDERVAEEFTAPGDEVERIMYGWSILHCLPAGMAEQPSAATGTVMRPGRLRQYAQDAGFQDVKALPVDNLFFRLYRLIP
jgi:2-polyprenyl-3-methyl-5-hydroxy-6-metoxy-1,4-benzoquinol methylase